MVSNFQDDDRENSMISLFNLYKDESEGRSGVDAFLDFNGKAIPFELKTTSQGSVTTVRDFGPDHIEKWKNKHWLI
jgi:penicillin-binding protein-related factor A (putative recombinase)